METDIQRELYRQTLRLLNEAVDRGFTLSIEENREFVEELKHNNAVFAAFKTHREQNDLAAIRSARTAEGGGKVYGRGRPIYRNTYR